MDLWCSLNPETKFYSHYTSAHNNYSSIDYPLVSHTKTLNTRGQLPMFPQPFVVV